MAKAWLFVTFNAPTAAPVAMELKVLAVLLSVLAPEPNSANPYPLLVMGPLRVTSPTPPMLLLTARLMLPEAVAAVTLLLVSAPIALPSPNDSALPML